MHPKKLRLKMLVKDMSKARPPQPHTDAEVWWLATEWRWARCDSEIEAELEAQAGNAFSLPSFLNAEAIAKCCFARVKAA